MMLNQTASGATTMPLAAACPERSRRDGLDRIAEYDASNVLQHRYVHGPAMDEPLVWYEGTGTSTRRFLSADERGSIVSVTNSTGLVIGRNRYDEYGQPQATNVGAFGYTGQAWLPSVGLWYYKARVYEPELGRFLQTDPIGYGPSPNLYAYVLNDPVNLVDPLGLSGGGFFFVGDIIVTGHRQNPYFETSNYVSEYGWNGAPVGGISDSETIVVTGRRPRRRTNRLPTRLPIVPIPVSFDDPAELFMAAGAKKADYCGSAGNSAMVPESIGASSMVSACRAHDNCYATLGAERSQCDAALLQDMLQACARNGASPLCVTSTYIFYVFVKIFGQDPFDDAQAQTKRRRF